MVARLVEIAKSFDEPVFKRVGHWWSCEEIITVLDTRVCVWCVCVYICACVVCVCVCVRACVRVHACVYIYAYTHIIDTVVYTVIA